MIAKHLLLEYYAISYYPNTIYAIIFIYLSLI